MTINIPIYQMAFGHSIDGEPGCIFAIEQEAYSTQSILFVMPILDKYERTKDFVAALESQKIFFPFQLGDEYYNLIGKLNFPELTFTVPGTTFRITFQFDTDRNFGWDIFPFRRRPYRHMRYVGRKHDLVMENNGFIVLHPVDVSAMNDLYLIHNGVFVGLTPNFGDKFIPEK